MFGSRLTGGAGCWSSGAFFSGGFSPASFFSSGLLSPTELVCATTCGCGHSAYDSTTANSTSAATVAAPATAHGSQRRRRGSSGIVTWPMCQLPVVFSAWNERDDTDTYGNRSSATARALA